jgi:N-acetylmuramoyl-L-alanine amidase
MRILIDAGHGGSDPGANGGGMKEKKVNLNVALKLRDLLVSHRHTVAMTRTDDKYLTLSQRVAIINEFNPDIAISIHHNAGGGDGAEVIYQMNPRLTARSKKLADLIGAEFKKLNNVRRIYSRESIKHKGQDYYTILSGKYPTVITEFAFMDTKDVQAIDTLREQHMQAVAISEAIKKYEV